MAFDELDKTISRRQYTDLMRAAAFLGHGFKGEREDMAFRDEGGTIIYTLDTNVLVSEAAPWRNGPLSDMRLGGVGQFLPRLYRVPAPQRFSRAAQTSIARRQLDEDRLAVRASVMLTGAALKRAERPGGGYFLLPGHAEEADEVGRSIAHSQKQARSSVDLEKQRHDLAAQVAADIGAIAELGNTIKSADLLDEIIEKIRTREARSERNVAAMNARYSGLKLHELDWQTFEAMPIKGHHRHAEREYAGRETLARDFLDWYWHDRLKPPPGRNSGHDPRRGAKTSRRPPRNSGQREQDADHVSRRTDRDVKAMTALTLYNRRCMMSGTRARIVLITADRNLVRATYRGTRSFREDLKTTLQRYDAERGGHRSDAELEKIRLFFHDDIVDDENSWFDSFALHYVRHLHAFADEGLQRSDGVGPTDFLSIFSSLFLDQNDAMLDSASYLEKLATEDYREEDRIENFRERYKSSIESWDTLIHQIAGKTSIDEFQNISPAIKRQMEHALKDRLEAQKRTGGTGDAGQPDRLVLWLEELVEQAHDRAMLHFSNVAIDLLVEKDKYTGRERWIARNPPDLAFHTLGNCKRIFEQLAQPDGFARKPPKVFHDAFDAIENDIPDTYEGDGRLESHLKLLVLGAAFAAAERWSAAIDHADRAIQIIERGRELGNPVLSLRGLHDTEEVNFSGREAYYLRAVCERTTVRAPTDDIDIDAETPVSIKGIEHAREILEQSCAALAEDTSRNETMNGKRLDLRNAAEDISITLAEYYIRRSLFRGDPTDYSPHCRASMQYLLDRVDTMAERGAWYDYFMFESGPATLSGLSMANNLIQLHLVLHFWNLGEPAARWREREALQRAVGFMDDVVREKNLIVSDLLEFYRMAGHLLYAADGPPASVKVADAQKLYDRLFRGMKTDIDQWRLPRLGWFFEQTLPGFKK